MYGYVTHIFKSIMKISCNGVSKTMYIRISRANATLWAGFKCYQMTSQPVNLAICMLLFCQLYFAILFR